MQADIIKCFHNEFVDYRYLLYHPKNNSKNKIDGNRNKALGVVAGIPDLCLAVAHKDRLYGSLRIELKLPGQKPTQEQLFMHEKLRNSGNKVVICYSTESAIAEIRHYIYG